MIEVINESSVVKLLFWVGNRSLGFKTVAIDFNAKKFRTLLVDGKDPFIELRRIRIVVISWSK